MATNCTQPEGDVLTLTAPYTVASGAGALVGKIFGVALDAVASGSEGEFKTKGIFTLAKLSTSVWVKGKTRIYWDDTNKRCDSDPAVGPCIGIAFAAAANPSSTGSVRLIGEQPLDKDTVSAGPAAASKNTAGAVTLTAAEVLGGIVVADCAGAGRTYTLPTAALLVAAMPGAAIGDIVRCKIVNGSDAAETLTLAAGAGGAFDANQTAASQVIPQNTSKDVLIRITNVTASSEAYVVYA